MEECVAFRRILDKDFPGFGIYPRESKGIVYQMVEGKTLFHALNGTTGPKFSRVMMKQGPPGWPKGIGNDWSELDVRGFNTVRKRRIVATKMVQMPPYTVTPYP